MADFAVLGKPGQVDKNAQEIVTGKIEVADDVWMGQKLFGKIFYSPHAHAKVKSIDTSAAAAYPGVAAVVTYKDVPGWSDVALWVGAPVAAVAAVDDDTCYQALKLIKVEWETLPAVISPDEAMKQNAPLVGLWPDNNMHERVNVKWGDVEAGFTQADAVVDEAMGWSTTHQNAPIGGGSCTAWWVGDELYAWVDTQNPHSEHVGFAGSFQMPQNRVRVYTHGNGGGFGSGRVNCQIVAAALAKKTGRVVSVHTDRVFQFIGGQRQFRLRAQIKMGAKKDGTITAIKAEYWGDQGAAASPPITDCHMPLAVTFKHANGSHKINGIITNTMPTGYYRCVAHPGGAFLANIALTKLAEKIGMDPFEFRMKNLVTPADKDALTGNVEAMVTIKETLQEVADKLGYDSKKHAPGAKTLPDGRKHGIAITGHLDGHGGYSPGRGAIITLRKDGTCYLNAGISRVGCGTATAHCHFVAETMGLKYDDVRIGDYGNTSVTADGGMQAGSTNTTCCGAAFVMAAKDALAQVKETAAGLLSVKPEELDARDSKVFVKADPTKFKTYAEVAAKNGFIIGRGVAWPAVLQRPVLSWPVGTPCTQRPACAAGCEIAVDTDTGEIEILNYVAVTDIGRMVYYDGIQAQGEAGYIHMLAQGIFWDYIVDQTTGRTLNPCFLNHRFPSSLDQPLDPSKYTISIREGDSAVGPYGATGAGEPVSSNYACISQAVYNAIGAWVTESPMHPWYILKALGKA